MSAEDTLKAVNQETERLINDNNYLENLTPRQAFRQAFSEGFLFSQRLELKEIRQEMERSHV